MKTSTTIYVVPPEHREQEYSRVERRTTGFHDPIGKRPAAYRALSDRPLPADGSPFSWESDE
jgi:hypothetical protein